MLICTSSNKLTTGKNQRWGPQNLDNLKNGRTLDRGWAFGNLPYYSTHIKALMDVMYQQSVGLEEDIKSAATYCVMNLRFVDQQSVGPGEAI